MTVSIDSKTTVTFMRHAFAFVDKTPIYLE